MPVHLWITRAYFVFRVTHRVHRHHNNNFFKKFKKNKKFFASKRALVFQYVEGQKGGKKYGKKVGIWVSFSQFRLCYKIGDVSFFLEKQNEKRKP